MNILGKNKSRKGVEWRLGAVAILNRDVRKCLTKKRSHRGKGVGHEAAWDKAYQVGKFTCKSLGWGYSGDCTSMVLWRVQH